MTSRALDEHGVIIPGRVHHKSETIRVLYSSWERSCDATIEYTVPESRSTSFFTVHPGTQQYDELHAHQAVEVRYLPRRDLPNLPLTKMLWEIHALPTVRLGNFQESTKLQAFLTPRVLLVCKILAGLAALLILLRILHRGWFAWAAGIAVVGGLAFMLLQDFPRPTPPPVVEVRHGNGHVTSLGLIDKLFEGAHERGIVADQPVDVVAIEFVPEGRTDPVVAVDLIDHGSVPGLQERSTVTFEYEDRSPRTAYIDHATRTFPKRNFSGIVLWGVLSLAALIGLIAVWQWISKAFNRLIAR
jgi:hypothetical protein